MTAVEFALAAVLAALLAATVTECRRHRLHRRHRGLTTPYLIPPTWSHHR